MTDETTSLVLEHLSHICSVVDNMHAEMKHFIMGVALPEQNVVRLHVADAPQNVEIDRIKERLERIERRFELTEG